MPEQEQEINFKKLFIPLTPVKAIHWFILVGFIVFFNSLFNSFVLEDKALILRNPSIHSISAIPSLFFGQVGGQETITYYRPLLFTFYAILYALFGENSFFYHLVQLIFWIADTSLIFFIIKKFTRIEIAFVAALLFMVHPMNEETVVWITNLQEVLYLFFGLIAISILLRNTITVRLLIIANCCLLLSLLSKETGILFFVVTIVYLYFFKSNKLLLHLCFSGVAGFVYLVLRLVSHTPLAKEALVPIMSLSLVERMISVPAIIFYYLQTFFFPKDLVVYHSWIITSLQTTTFFLPLLFDGIFFLCLFFICLSVIKKGGDKKAIILFLSWFVIGLVFHLQLFPLDFTVADHFFNFAFIGLLSIGSLMFTGIHLNKIRRTAFVILAILVLGSLSLRTMIRNTNWQKQTTILTHDERVAPNDYLLELVYSTDLIQNNHDTEAISHIQKAIQLYPKSSRAWSSLGVIYYNEGKIIQAKQAFLHSIALDNYFGAYENLGLLEKDHDTPQHAIVFLRKAINLYPNSDKLWYDRFIVAYKLKNYDEALLAAKYYYLLTRDAESYAIYTHMLQNAPIHIE